MMDTNLKFSLITTVIALGVIVAFVIDVMLLTSDVTPSSLTV
ncbi:MAG: YnhF family membrane protein [Klebsiella sp.]|nr:YnhF family membrane protein [Klebsiella sp.]MDU3363195.1 YnhF family membrane protein [Klebsiella sp.]